MSNPQEEIGKFDWKFITIIFAIGMQWATLQTKMEGFIERQRTHVGDQSLHHNIRRDINSGDLIPRCGALAAECGFTLKNGER